MNKLKLWTFSGSTSYYLTHPWKWIKDAYWNIRNFIHRGRYGYAYSDVWEWFVWWPTVGAEALRYLRDHGCGYPGIDQWDTPEKWADYLTNLADKLEWCTNDDTDEENEFKDEFKRMYEMRRIVTDDGFTFMEMTDEDKKIRDKYFARSFEIEEEHTQKRIEIFEELGKVLPRLWD